jgi:hypothetical protein
MLGAIRMIMRLDAVMLMHMRRPVIAKAVHGSRSIRESKRGVRGEHAECVSRSEKDRRSDAKKSGQASQHRFEDKSVPQHCNICLAPFELHRTADSGQQGPVAIAYLDAGRCCRCTAEAEPNVAMGSANHCPGPLRAVAENCQTGSSNIRCADHTPAIAPTTWLAT